LIDSRWAELRGENQQCK